MSKIYLITGSTLGMAEYLGEDIAKHLNSLSGYEIERINGSVPLSVLSDLKNLIIVTSTFGSGEVPENLQPLIEDFALDSASDDPQLDYSQIKYFIVALGSTEYDLFCGSKDHIEAALSKAIKVVDSLTLDVGDLELDYETAAIDFVAQNVKYFN